MKNCLSGLCAAFLFISATSASAALVSAVSATTTMGSAFQSDLANTINGVGLDSLSLTATHGSTDPSNSWISDEGTLSGKITFDLGGVFAIQGFSFWNQNAGGPGEPGAAGIRDLVVSTSLDNVTFTAVPGAPIEFAEDPNAVGIAQPFSFDTVNAQYVQFAVASNYGDPRSVGFAEVQFDSRQASVPDGGSTLVMLGTLLLGFAVVKYSKPLNS